MNADLWEKLELVRETGLSREYLNYLTVVWMSVYRQPNEDFRTKDIREFGPAMLDYSRWLRERIATLNAALPHESEACVYTIDDSYFDEPQARKEQKWRMVAVDASVDIIRRETARRNIDFSNIAMCVRDIFTAIQGKGHRSQIEKDFPLK